MRGVLTTTRSFFELLAEIPRQECQEKDYVAWLSGYFNKYLDAIRSASPVDPVMTKLKNNIDRVSVFTASIKDTIRHYLDGSPQLAYQHLASALETPFISGCLTSLQPDSMGGIRRDLFRTRQSRTGFFQKKDLFHVPFEKRGKIQSQRFSISGLPCLYLGGSIYVCWEEMGRPLYSDLHISRFEASADVKIVDLAFTPMFWLRIVGDSGAATWQPGLAELMFSIAVFWPITFSCSNLVSAERK